MYDGEVHFNPLYHNDPEICIRLMTDLGRENILIVYKVVKKREKFISRKKKHIPIDELYLFSILSEILSAIQIIDSSDMIVVTYDKNTNIREETCSLLWNDRCVLVLGESKAYRLIQMADLCASSVGKASLSDRYSDPRQMEKIVERSVDISKRLVGCTQHPSFASMDDNRCSKYKNTSAKEKSDSKFKSDYNKNKKPLRAIQSKQCLMIASNEKRLDGCRSTRRSPLRMSNGCSNYKTIGTKGEGSA